MESNGFLATFSGEGHESGGIRAHSKTLRGVRRCGNRSGEAFGVRAYSAALRDLSGIPQREFLRREPSENGEEPEHSLELGAWSLELSSRLISPPPVLLSPPLPSPPRAPASNRSGNRAVPPGARHSSLLQL